MKWKPGESGNPNGARKARIITQQLIAELNETDPAGITKLRRVVQKLIAKAIEGDVQAINAVMDRVEGKPPQFTTGDAEAFRRATELSDDELAAIATAGGDRTAETESRPAITH